MIGTGPAIADVAEFNRRALIAFKAVDFGDNTTGADIVESCRRLVTFGHGLSIRQQRALYQIAYRYRHQITDRSVVEFASVRAGSYA